MSSHAADIRKIVQTLNMSLSNETNGSIELQNEIVSNEPNGSIELQNEIRCESEKNTSTSKWSIFCREQKKEIRCEAEKNTSEESTSTNSSKWSTFLPKVQEKLLLILLLKETSQTTSKFEENLQSTHTKKFMKYETVSLLIICNSLCNYLLCLSIHNWLF